MIYAKAVAARPRPRRILNPLTLLLLWASKTDHELVLVCSRWAIATQAAFGLLVLFTTSLAFCSSYYTLSTLNVSDRWVLWIAAAYTCFIFVLDREIVGGLDKVTAFVRPLMALMIGMVVAVPVELWIFQDRVDQQLAMQYRENNREQPDIENHAQVAAVIRNYGETWTADDNLIEICEELDRRKIPVPKTWLMRKEGPARSWSRGRQHYPHLVIKAIKDRCMATMRKFQI
jgi:hypothetical protein